MTVEGASAVILAGVRFLGEREVGLFAILGVPPRGAKPGDLPTVIGAGAVIRSHTVIYAGNRIGKHFQTGHHVTVREENEIGDDVSVGTGTVIEHHVKIENGVRIHSQAFVPEWSILMEGAWIGPNVVVTNAYHPLCPEAKKCLKGVTLGRHAKIGANATIMPDIVIGDWAVVGAGAVVTKHVPARAVVAGNPARQIKTIDDLSCPYDIIDAPYPRSGDALFPPSPVRPGHPPQRHHFEG